jgi:Arc/MetJ-type ribon-helix-helix transcriptional regulator
MNAAIPDELQDLVLSRIREGGFATVDDYVGCLVQADLRRSSQDSLEAELLRGLEGERVKLSPDDFDQLRQSLRERYVGDQA